MVWVRFGLSGGSYNDVVSLPKVLRVFIIRMLYASDKINDNASKEDKINKK